MTDNEIIKELEKALKVAEETINRQKAEIERLEEMLDSAVSSEANTVDTTNYMIAEAVKEFAEIIKQNKDMLFNSIYSRINFDIQIDNLAKEMVGDE